MKNSLIILILLIYSNELLSQNISVKLSIEWKKTITNNWKNYKLKKTPFLNIEYVNDSNDSCYSIEYLYFFKQRTT